MFCHASSLMSREGSFGRSDVLYYESLSETAASESSVPPIRTSICPFLTTLSSLMRRQSPCQTRVALFCVSQNPSVLSIKQSQKNRRIRESTLMMPESTPFPSRQVPHLPSVTMYPLCRRTLLGLSSRKRSRLRLQKRPRQPSLVPPRRF